MIFQNLEDLEKACAEASPPNMISREHPKFEVGVFNGRYVTPVAPGYFEHLEKVRGESKKMKLMESAREAVANGSAGREEYEMATNGFLIKDDGSVEPLSPPTMDQNSEHNVTEVQEQTNGKRQRESSGDTPSPRERMDISLHNFGDYTG